MAEPEEWRLIRGADGYEVSSLGRVRSPDRMVRTRNNQLRRYKGRVMKADPTNDYPRVNVRRSWDGRPWVVAIHAAVAAAFLGPRPLGMEVAHNDGDRLNPRLSNLRYDTPKGNQADRLGHDTHLCGGRHPGATLTDEQAAEIADRFRRGEVQHRLATEFGVTRAAVAMITQGRSWGSVTGISADAPRKIGRRWPKSPESPTA